VAKKKDVSVASERASVAATKTAETLPKIRGAVCVQWRIYKGKRLGPYYFRFWREDGKLRKRYIKRANLALTIAACRKDREERREQRENHAEVMRWIREYNRADREIERLLKAVRLVR
jgi:hypothetical protein